MSPEHSDIQLLSAYLDDELSPTIAATIEQRLRREPALRALFQALQLQHRECLREFNAIDSVPLPDKLNKVLMEPEPSSQKSGSSFFEKLGLSLSFLAAPQIVSVCAMLIGIIGVFTLTQNREHSPELSAVNSSPELYNALDKLVAGETIHANDMSVYEVLAFRHVNGSLCKHYVLTAERQFHGIACFSDARWQSEVYVANSRTQQTEGGSLYKPADGAADKSIDTFIEANISGAVLAPKDEHEILSMLKKDHHQ